MGVYQNRNYHKLQIYQKRRMDYISGKSKNLNGEKYAAENYGFPKEVVNFTRFSALADTLFNRISNWAEHQKFNQTKAELLFGWVLVFNSAFGRHRQ